MNIFFIHHSAKKPGWETNEHSLSPMHNHDPSTNEGSEFLDDALRTEDLPALHTEEDATGEDHNQ